MHIHASGLHMLSKNYDVFTSANSTVVPFCIFIFDNTVSYTSSESESTQ